VNKMGLEEVLLTVSDKNHVKHAYYDYCSQSEENKYKDVKIVVEGSNYSAIMRNCSPPKWYTPPKEKIEYKVTELEPEPIGAEPELSLEEMNQELLFYVAMCFDYEMYKSNKTIREAVNEFLPNKNAVATYMRFRRKVRLNHSPENMRQMKDLYDSAEESTEGVRTFLKKLAEYAR